jgi:hypothetical protein
VLREIGMSMPSTPRRALVSLLWRRALIRLRGLRFRERDQSQISPEALTRIDTCWSLAHALGFVNTILAADFEARTLLLAIHAGEPTRLVRNLTMEAAYQSFRGAPSRARVATLLSVLTGIARTHDSPEMRAWEAAGRGATDY